MTFSLQQVLDEKDLTINELEAEIESRSREYEQVMNQLDETSFVLFCYIMSLYSPYPTFSYPITMQE